MGDPITTDSARVLRKLWFDYLDEVGAIRPKLHAYCLRLTGSVWSAEDLVQDTLLRGFGAIGRGDMNPAGAPDGNGGRRWFDQPQAYLCQIATNLWIDHVRRAQREARTVEAEAVTQPSQAVVTPAAGAALFERVAPQERAAVVLKDVFDFSLEEIAVQLSTTTGAVKAALHRGRARLQDEDYAVPSKNPPASRALVDAFIAAFNARDVAAVKDLLLESCTWEVQGVGGERGKRTIWLQVAFREGVMGSQHEVDGERIACFTGERGSKTYLGGVLRLEEVDGRVSRIINYGFCGDTIAYVAAKLASSPPPPAITSAARSPTG